MSDDDQHASLIKFPCDFPIKVMGKANIHFEEKVINMVLRHFPEIDLAAVTKRPSKDNNYLALTFNVHAESKEQLDALYEELSSAPEVLIAL